MTLVSRLAVLRNALAWSARNYRYARALTPLAALTLLLAPAAVRADIYKWTDERGITVISNVQPANSAKASGMELLAVEAKPAAPAPGAASKAGPTRTEQALQARVENLERQLQAQQSQGVPQSGYAEDSYPAALPPPPDPNYYGNYDPNYYSGYDPNYYNSGYDPFYSSGYYPYALPLAYSYIAVPPRHGMHRPGFVNRPHAPNRPPAVTGRPPVFTGRPPVFTARPPVFTTRASAFATHAVSGSSRSASSGGGRR